jgi:hypothetical protein
MKYILLTSLAVFCLFAMVISPIIAKHAVAFAKDVIQAFKLPVDVPRFSRQAGLVTLLRPYGGYSAGQSVGLTASTEAALIASGGASNAATVTAGPLTTNQPAGVCAVLAGQSSVVITNPLITPQSRVWAVISQTTADTTALYVARVVAAAGSVTIFVNANATANTQIDWSIGYNGTLANPT